MNQKAKEHIENELARAEARLEVYTRDSSGSLYPMRYFVEKVEAQMKAFV